MVWRQHGEAEKNGNTGASRVTLGKFLKLSVPLLPNRESGDGKCTYLHEAVWRTNKSMGVKHLEWCPAQRKYSINHRDSHSD